MFEDRTGPENGIINVTNEDVFTVKLKCIVIIVKFAIWDHNLIVIQYSPLFCYA